MAGNPAYFVRTYSVRQSRSPASQHKKFFASRKKQIAQFSEYDLRRSSHTVQRTNNTTTIMNIRSAGKYGEDEDDNPGRVTNPQPRSANTCGEAAGRKDEKTKQDDEKDSKPPGPAATMPGAFSAAPTSLPKKAVKYYESSGVALSLAPACVEDDRQSVEDSKVGVVSVSGSGAWRGKKKSETNDSSSAAGAASLIGGTKEDNESLHGGDTIVGAVSVTSSRASQGKKNRARRKADAHGVAGSGMEQSVACSSTASRATRENCDRALSEDEVLLDDDDDDDDEFDEEDVRDCTPGAQSIGGIEKRSMVDGSNSSREVFKATDGSNSFKIDVAKEASIRSNSLDDNMVQAMLVEADLAPELILAEEVNIQEEEEIIIKRQQYKRILWFAMVFYGIAIIGDVAGIIISFISPPLAFGQYYVPLFGWGFAAVFLFVATILIFVPSRCCSSIRLEQYAPDDKQLLRDAQIASVASLCVFNFVAIPIIVLLPKRQGLGYAFMTWLFPGTVFALLRVRLLRRSIETRQNKSKVFWAVLVAFFLALFGTTIWRFNPLFPDCIVEYPSYIGDGVCDGFPPYNTEECGLDGGDCFIEDYPECIVEIPSFIGDGNCDGGTYNTEECGYDGGDCTIDENYPGCFVTNISAVGDAYCNFFQENYNTRECGFDGGDCIVDGYPNCIVEIPSWIGDTVCDGGMYNTTECGYDGGDCSVGMAINNYPDCSVEIPILIGDGFCDGGLYGTEECGFDGGDCLKPGERCRMHEECASQSCNPNSKVCNSNFAFEQYPNCFVEMPSWIGDGECDGRLYGTVECGFDGGDCLQSGEPCLDHVKCASQVCNPVTKVCDSTSGLAIEQYSNCSVSMPSWIGDGECDGGSYASEACGFDGGDCFEPGEPCLQDDECASKICRADAKVCDDFRLPIDRFPDCFIEFPSWIGDGECDAFYAFEVCGFDGGDCLQIGKPCLQDDECASGLCNADAKVCDPGIFEQYPNCTAPYHWRIGDGKCDGIPYYDTEDCGFDGGDCIFDVGEPCFRDTQCASGVCGSDTNVCE